MTDDILPPTLGLDKAPDVSPLYRTNEAHYKRAIALADQCTDAVISTFGVWAGITEHNQRAGHPYTAKLLEAMPKGSRVLVGVPEDKPCHSLCETCKMVAAQARARIKHTIEHFDHIEWQSTTSHHMKLMAFKVGGEWVALVGGRNLTDSSWTDTTFELDGDAATHAVSYFEETWK